MCMYMFISLITLWCVVVVAFTTHCYPSKTRTCPNHRKTLGLISIITHLQTTKERRNHENLQLPQPLYIQEVSMYIIIQNALLVHPTCTTYVNLECMRRGFESHLRCSSFSSEKKLPQGLCCVVLLGFLSF